MAFTAEQNQAIRDYVAANIDNPAAIASAAAEFGVSPQALATAVGVAENEVISYFNNAGVAPPSAVYSPEPESAYAPDSSAASRGASHFVDGVQIIPGAPGYDPNKAAMRLAEIASYGGVAGEGAAATLRANNLFEKGMGLWGKELERLHQLDIAAGRVPVGTPAPKPNIPQSPSAARTSASTSTSASPAASIMPAGYDQAYVNNLVRQAAMQVGGSLSYQDLLRAASNLGIPEDKINAAVSTGVVTGVPPSVIQTTASGPSWDYNKYFDSLKSGNADYNQELGKLGGMMGQNAQNVYREILAQQSAGSSEFWYAGNTASPQAAAADFALRLAENGIGSLSQLGQLTIEDPSMEGPAQQITINKATGQPLPRPELLGRGQRGLDIDYNLTFAADGTVIPFTSNRESSWMQFRENTLKPAAAFALATVGAPLIGATVAPGLAAATQGAIGGAIAGGGAAALTGGNVLQGALLGGLGGYANAGGFGGGAQAPGLGPQTDASFLAADAAQLAASGLSEAQIAQVLGASGYGSSAAANLAASMAVNGLDVNMMTQQLQNLSTNTGLMSQTGSSADFLAADAIQLRGQLGNNFAAIEQNLIASGVDPLIAADISQQLAFNPNLTQTDLATRLSNSFGSNIYDVNMAQTYPTSVLPGAGGLLSNVAGAGGGAAAGAGIGTTTAGAGAGTNTGLTTGQVGNLVKAGLGLVGTAGAVRAATGGGGGFNAPMQAPTQGVPTNDPNYYNQLQQYYNAYLPQTPRDVVTPLQQWYNSRSGA